MGLYDRDYYRTPSRPTLRSRAQASVRFVSVNTWLILLCVGVFLADGILERMNFVRWVPTGQFFPRQSLGEIEAGERAYGKLVETPPGIAAWYLQRQLPPPTAMIEVLDRPRGGNAVLVGLEAVQKKRVIESYLAFSTGQMIYSLEYWRLIGFQFLHANFGHLLFNMLGLYFFGPMVEQYLGSKRYLAFYLLCGICGALLYLLLNLGGIIATEVFRTDFVIPGLLFNDIWTPLVGASAGIFGVLMAGAYLAPNELAFFLFLPMRLATLAWVLIGLAIFSLITHGPNAGGQAAHLGGAIAGWIFIRRPHHLHNFFDILGRADPTSHHYRGGRGLRRGGAGEGVRPGEIDRILDKVTAQGLHSLTDAEKRLLAEDTNRRRGS